MIQINLLPYHLRPIKRTPLPYVLSALVFILVVLGMAAVFLHTQAQIARQEANLAQCLAELSKLDSVVKDSNRLVELKQQLATKIQTIDDIVKDRIIWSRQLWSLARLSPDNVWYSGIKVVLKPFRQMTKVMDPNSKKEVSKETTIQKPVLQVSGYVVAAKDGSTDVSPLAKATEQDPEFSGLFRLDTSTLKDTEFEDQQVKSFTLEYLVQVGGRQ